MDPHKLKSKHGPEFYVKEAIRKMLILKGWWVKIIHGNEFQSGLPDLFIAKRGSGTRWVEIKLPGMVGSRFTNAQLEVFPRMTAEGVGVWILTADTEDEYEKLFKPPNWYQYLDIMKH